MAVFGVGVSWTVDVTITRNDTGEKHTIHMPNAVEVGWEAITQRVEGDFIATYETVGALLKVRAMNDETGHWGTVSQEET